MSKVPGLSFCIQEAINGPSEAKWHMGLRPFNITHGPHTPSDTHEESLSGQIEKEREQKSSSNNGSSN